MIPWMKQPETVRNDVASYPFMAKASEMGKYLIFDRTAPLATDRKSICKLVQDCVDAFDARSEYGYNIVPRTYSHYDYNVVIGY